MHKTKTVSEISEATKRKHTVRNPVRENSDIHLPSTELGSLEEGSLEPTVENYAALLADPRLSHPTNAVQKARLVNQLQQHYGNAYVQKTVAQIQAKDEGTLSDNQRNIEGIAPKIDAEREFVQQQTAAASRPTLNVSSLSEPTEMESGSVVQKMGNVEGLVVVQHEAETIPYKAVETEGGLYIPGEMARCYHKLPAEERAKVTQEVNARFREATGVERKLDWKDPKDKPLARKWLRIRDAVMGQGMILDQGLPKITESAPTKGKEEQPVQEWLNILGTAATIDQKTKLYQSLLGLGLSATKITIATKILKSQGASPQQIIDSLRHWQRWGEYVEITEVDLWNSSSPLHKIFKTIGNIGKALGVITSIVRIANHISKNQWGPAASEAYKGVTSYLGAGWAGLTSTVQSLIGQLCPGVQDHPMLRVILSFNIVEMGGVAVDSIGTIGQVIFTEKTAIPALDELVERMRKGPARPFAKTGESLGNWLYGVLHPSEG